MQIWKGPPAGANSLHNENDDHNVEADEIQLCCLACHEGEAVREECKAKAPSLRGRSSVAQSCPTVCDPWTVARQAPLSTGFPRQEYWSGLPLPSPPRSCSEQPPPRPSSERISCHWLTTVSSVSRMREDARSLKLFLQYLPRANAESFKAGFPHTAASGLPEPGSRKWTLPWNASIPMMANA